MSVEDRNAVIALMYHDIVEKNADDHSGFPGRDAARYKVTTALFEDHLSALARVSRLPVLTFDDGGVSAMATADMLDSYGFVGQFFITTNFIGTRGFLDPHHIRELSARGHGVGSHSASHPLRIGRCSPATLVDEWTRSRAALEDILGAAVRTASVPGGDFAPRVAEAAARAGIARLFTSEPTSRVRRIGNLDLIGRFTIQRWTVADTVGRLARGDWFPRARQAVIWNAKKATKRVGGRRYLELRKLLIGGAADVQWGDR